MVGDKNRSLQAFTEDGGTRLSGVEEIRGGWFACQAKSPWKACGTRELDRFESR